MLHMNGGKWSLILGAPSLNMWPWWSLASIGQHCFTSGITTPFIRDFEIVHSRHRIVTLLSEMNPAQWNGGNPQNKWWQVLYQMLKA